MEKILVHPLEKVVIHRDILLPGNPYVLDRLTKDLKFDRKIANSTETSPRKALKEFQDQNVKIRGGKIRYKLIPQSGWVEVEELDTWEQTWKLAMQTLKQQVTQ